MAKIKIAKMLCITNENSKHLSNLENLAKQFPECMKKNMEKIQPYIRPPWWTPSVEIHVDNSKAEAKQHHERNANMSSTLQIYTDGSGIAGNIGAAAYCSNTNQTQHKYLGKETDHNVYAAELKGIGLAGKIVQQHIENYTQCLIHMDSQAAIKAIGKPKHQSGQAIIKRTLDIIDNVKKRKPNIKSCLRWVPGHQNIEGNETADQAAKHAANNDLAP